MSSSPPSQDSSSPPSPPTPPPPKDSSSSSPPQNSPPSSPPPSPSKQDSPSPPPPSPLKQDSPSQPSPQSSPPPPPSQQSSPPPPNSSSNNKSPSPPPPPPPPPRQSNSPNHRPPTPHSRAPPTPRLSSPKSSHKESSSSSTPSTTVIGAAIGGAVFLILLFIIMCVVICSPKKKRKKSHEYFGSNRSGGDYYSSSQQQMLWHNSSHGGNQYRLQQQVGPGGSPGGICLSPPPPMAPSSEMSSYYSGPHQNPLPPPPPPNYSLGMSQSSFSYEELAAATGGFSQGNLLGQGGFGYVHKGVLPNGKEVAVKSLKSGSGQGEREFQAEVEIISRVHHRHLVSLVGYCISGRIRMLVYEFVPNGTMEHHLHGKGQPTMDWPTRLRIATGSAKGLAYLHEDCHPRIIHRDIKSANILLDNNFEAMVADFGLAKLSNDTNTHVSTRIMGTFGYLAPEYASSGKLTEKSDVFSYGVMLLELITGKRPVDPYNRGEDSLVDWARPLLDQAIEESQYEGLADIGLDNNFNPKEMLRMVTCAAATIRHSARRRPKMSQIVRALEGDTNLEDLNDGIKSGLISVGSSLSSAEQPNNVRW